MIKSNYCLLDCETGGLDFKKNPITQFAAVILDGRTLKELDRWETFVKPYDGKVIDKAALQHTMVSMSDINAGISKKEFATTAKAWFGEHQAKATRADMGRLIMVGHNVLLFDRPFLDECFAEFGWSCDDYFYPGGNWSDWEKQVQGLILSNDPVYMKYKSTPHAIIHTNASLSLTEDTIFNEGEEGEYTLPKGDFIRKEYPYLYCAEIYRQENQSTDFGGRSEMAIHNNIWYPAGPAIPINPNGETIVEYLYGDTYY